MHASVPGNDKAGAGRVNLLVILVSEFLPRALFSSGAVTAAV